MQSPKRNKLNEALKTLKGAFIFVGIFSLFVNLAMLIVPIFMLQVYDRVLSSQSHETLLMLSALAGILLVLMGFVEVSRSRLLVRIGTDLHAKLSSPLFLGAFCDKDTNSRSAASQPLRDLETLRTFMTGAGIIAFFDAPWTPIYLAILFLFHPILGAVALAGALVIFSLALLSEAAVRTPLAKSGTATRQSNEFIDVLARNAEPIRVMGMLPNLENRWSAQNESGVAWQAIASDRIGTIQAIAKTVRLGLQIAILGTGAWLVLGQEMSAGVMVAGSIIMGRALAPIEAAIGHWRGFVRAREAKQRLDKRFENEPTTEVRTELPAPMGHLVAQQVGLRLPGIDAPVLHGVSFHLDPGELLGLIGPSGAGKTSLARLIVGASDPTFGTIRLDSAEIKDWPGSDFGDYLGYLPQDVELLNGTVAQNIARFKDVPSDAIVEAAKLASAHELILELADGYETQVGVGGRTLSGGQRQRIGLARAVFGNARLIVLDEPNANLDNDGETALRAALATLKKQKRTVVIITHKPSILNGADKILVLRDGQVEAFGPRDKVMSAMHRAVPDRKPPNTNTAPRAKTRARQSGDHREAS